MKNSFSKKIALALLIFCTAAAAFFFKNSAGSAHHFSISKTEKTAPTATKKQRDEQVFQKNKDLLLEVEGARLDVPAGALAAEVSISLEKLAAAALPPLDADLTNVSPDGGGFRCLPHGTVFEKSARFFMAFDTARIPDGYSAADVQTFYFDENARRWRTIPKDSLLAAGGWLASRTAHFTDFINGVLAVPDAPETASFVPTSLKDLKAILPTENLTLLSPPAANSMGNAALQLPLRLPAGRQGMQPQLSVNYNSESGAGWLGLGWDLSVPSIGIETRYAGVPIFDADLQSETYVFGGSQLAPVAHRAAFEPRTAGEVIFHPRILGGFQKIVRHGDSPKNYWWEVIEKDGSQSQFGGGDAAVLRDDAGNIVQWMLRETRDLNQNFVRYFYKIQEDAGVLGGSVLGRQIYLSEISYTGHGSTEGKFRVEFLRDRDLPGQPRRADVQISGRLGFKQVTADLLREVRISFDGQAVRKYEFLYEVGAFYKTLLAEVIEFDRAGKVFNRHSFEYFDEVRDAAGDYRPLETTAKTWDIGLDEVEGSLLSFHEPVSALGGSESWSYGFGIIVTIGPGWDLGSKNFSVGGGVNYSRSSSTGRLAHIDLDGDGLPDKVFKNGSKLYFRKNLARQNGNGTGLTAFGLPREIASVSDFCRSKTSTFGWNLEAHFVAFVGYNQAKSSTSTDVYFCDFNSDGLPDIASRGKVLFNHHGAGGVPEFDDTAQNTENPIVAGEPIDTSVLKFDPAEQDSLIDQFPLHDLVRVFRPPFKGKIRMDAPVRLVNLPDLKDYELEDGVRVAIQMGNGSKLQVADFIAADDFSEKYLVVPSQVFDVDTTDRIYFRVQSRFDGAFDRVVWQPKIEYLQIGNLANAGAESEANGQNIFQYDSQRDFLLAGEQMVTMPLRGKVQVSAKFQKQQTSDDLELQIVRTHDKNPTEIIFRKKYGWSAAASDSVHFSVDVVQDDQLSFRVVTHTNVDWTAVRCQPQFSYSEAFDTAGKKVQVLDSLTQKPLYTFCPTVGFSMFNHAFQKTPVWVSDADGQLKAEASFFPIPVNQVINFNKFSPLDSITLSIKTPKRLLGKTTFFVKRDSVVAGLREVLADVKKGDSVFVEFHLPSRPLADTLLKKFNSLSVEVSMAGSNPPSAAGVFTTLSENEFIFGALHRGWGGFAYNGNRDRSTKPIDEKELNIENAKKNAKKPDEIDAIDQPDQLSAKDDPSKSVFVMLLPDAKTQSWRGFDEFTYLHGDTLSSSRLGEDDILLTPPQPGQGFKITSPTKTSVSKVKSVAGGGGWGAFNLTLSKSWNDAQNQVETMDLNGDRYPEIVGKDKIQYSNHLGGLTKLVVQHSFGVSDSHAEAIGGTIGGTYVNAKNNNCSDAKNQSVKNSENKSGAVQNNQNKAESAPATAKASISVSGNYSENEDKTQHAWLDMNADGLPDKVFADGRVALNLGYRFAEIENWNAPFIREGSSRDFGFGLGVNWGNNSWAAGFSTSKTENQVEKTLQDMNGDGLLDLVWLANPLEVQLNTGNGFAPQKIQWHGAEIIERGATMGKSANVAFTFCFPIPIPFFPLKICVNPSANGGTGVSRQEAQFSDVDGDGFPDFLTSENDGDLKVRRSRIGKTNFLKKVSRPLGGTFSLDFQLVGNTYDLPQAKWVLSKVEVFDGLDGDGASRTASVFEYSEGKYSRREREFFGFKKVKTTQLDTENSDVAYRSREQIFLNENYFEKGLLAAETMRDAAGNLFSETKNSYQFRNLDGSQHSNLAADDAGVAFPALLKTEKLFFEGQPTAGLSTSTEMEYDLVGNIIFYKDAGDGSPDDLLAAVIEYHDDAAKHLKSVAKSIQVSAGGKPIRRRESDINAAGDVVQIRQFLENGTAATFDMEYDVFGNLEKINRPPNHRGQRMWFKFEYDDAVKTYVVRTSDAFGYASMAKYDLVFGQILETTDLNGERMEYKIDDAGRLTSITGPLELAAGKPYTLAFEYATDAPVPFGKTRHFDPETGGDIEIITFTDGLGRPVQVKKTGVIWDGSAEKQGFLVSGRAVFDALGRAVEGFYPIFETGAGIVFNQNFNSVKPTRTTFDVLDRPTQTVLPDGATTSILYDFGSDNFNLKHFQTTTTDPLGNSKSKFTDLRQRQRATRDRGPGGDIWTNFKFNALGELLEVSDHAGNLTTYEFDWLGRIFSKNLPDAGQTDFQFDLAGNKIFELTEELRQAVSDTAFIKFQYDFERLVQVDFPVNFQNQVKLHYGSADAKFGRAGRLWWQQDASGGQEFFYGKLGNVVKTIRTLLISKENQPTFVWEEERDTWDRVQKMVYPDGEVVEYDYNAAGKLRAMRGRKAGQVYNFVEQLGYDEFDQRVFCRLGNGTSTVFKYEKDRRRLSDLTLTLPDGRSVLDNDYGYDAVDNVVSITNNALPQALKIGGAASYSFQYDQLYRLSAASGTWVGHNRSESFDLEMKYDDLHNILQKTQQHHRDTALLPEGTCDFEYKYDGARPHVPTKIGRRDYSFDANGNATGWQVAGHFAWQKILWDEKNQLAAVSDNGRVSQYTYDWRGERAAKSTGGSQSAWVNGAPVGFVQHREQWVGYVSPQFVLREGQFTKHYFIEGQRIAAKLGGGGYFQNKIKFNPRLTAGGFNYAIRAQQLEEAKDKFWSSKQQTGVYPIPVVTVADSVYTMPPVAWEMVVPPPPLDSPPGKPIRAHYSLTNETVRAGYGFEPSADSSKLEDNQYFFHPDHLGSTTFVSDRDGAVREHLEYLPFGEIFVEEHTSAGEQAYRFTGKEVDPETGYYYFGARYYDPITSFWLAVDPLGEKYPGWSPFNYCLLNPVRFKDPDGRLPTLPTAVIGAAVGGILGGMTSYFLTEGSATQKFNAARTGALEGMVSGALVGSGAGFIIAVGGNTAASFVGQGFEKMESSFEGKNKEISPLEAVSDGLLGGFLHKGGEKLKGSIGKALDNLVESKAGKSALNELKKTIRAGLKAEGDLTSKQVKRIGNAMAKEQNSALKNSLTEFGEATKSVLENQFGLLELGKSSSGAAFDKKIKFQ